MPSSALDFSHRAQLSEWMDEPCSYTEFRDCLRDLEKVNRLVLAYRPTLKWIQREAKVLQSSLAGAPLHIVDVGCGGGDMLRRIEQWSKAQGIAVQLTGIDLNPYAALAASHFSGKLSSIEWITGDAFSYQPATPIHCVISSLFTHHLPEADLVRFVSWMEDVATAGWFVNDLHRQPHAYYEFKALAAVMRWHRFVQHDGPISIRRGFRRADWSRICTAAGLSAHHLTIDAVFPARLCVSRLKNA